MMVNEHGQHVSELWRTKAGIGICRPARDPAGMCQSLNRVKNGRKARGDERPCADHKLESTFKKQ